MRSMFTGVADPAAPLPAWITEDELAHYVGEFSRTGFTGALNWYRNYDRNYDRHRNDYRRGDDNQRRSDINQARPMAPPAGREDPYGGTNIPFDRNSQQ